MINNHPSQGRYKSDQGQINRGTESSPGHQILPPTGSLSNVHHQVWPLISGAGYRERAMHRCSEWQVGCGTELDMGQVHNVSQI